MYLTKVMKAQLAIYTDELKTLELPVPIEVQEDFNWFVSQNFRNTLRFVEHISERNGYLFQRTFCMHAHGKSKPATLRETGRRYEGCNMVCSNVIGGYMMTWQADDRNEVPEDMHESGWSPMYAGLIKRNGKTMFEYPAICVNKDEWLAKYPYCQWDTYSFNGRVWGINFFKFLCHYRDNPKIELLIKGGYRSFVGFKGLNMKGKTFEDIFGVKQAFAKEYLKHGTTIDLNILRANPWIEDEKTLNRYKEIKKIYGKDISYEEGEYLSRQQCSSYTYKDYIRFATELGYPLDQKKFKYPDDLQKEHDKAMKKIKTIRSKEQAKKIKELVNACQDFKYEKDGYCIFPMSCAEDLIKESKVLEHCVRTYIDKVARHNSLILFVRKSEDKDTPYVTLELVKDKDKDESKPLAERFNRITQVYGYKDSTPDKETCKFVMDFKKKFKLTGWTSKTA